MAGVVSRDAYFETGLEVLSDLGYGGLKLAEVCSRLRVTTGSFYHYFSNWPSFSRELVEYWRHQQTTRIVEAVRAEPSPRRRIDLLISEALGLPHGAEAAIRVWSSIDPDVHAVQAAVDQQRYDIMFTSALEVLHQEHDAERFAKWCFYVLVGYEQAPMPPDKGALDWIAQQMLDLLDSGRFTSAPADG
jgi:AcrR family transcriptional regulator